MALPSDQQRQELYTVQCDFDDTITTGNVSQALREAFASGQWKRLEAQYAVGQFIVEKSNRQQFALVKASKEEIQEYVSRTVVVRPGFSQFVDHCREVGIGFTIVSSGLDLYIEAILCKLGLPGLERYSGRGRVTAHGITVDYIDPWGVDHEEGFKLACLGYLKQRGQPIIYIGDGLFDIAPALEADYVIARDSLERHFDSMSLLHFTFDTFYDVQQIVKEHIAHHDIT